MVRYSSCQPWAAAWAATFSVFSVLPLAAQTRTAAAAAPAASSASAAFAAGAGKRIAPHEPAPVRRQLPRASPSAVETAPARVMMLGEVSTLSLPGVSRIAIGNGRIVKATVVDERQIVLLAETSGETNMHVWLKDGRQLAYPVQVLAARQDRLLADLKRYLDDVPSLRTKTVGDKIVLEGRYPDTETAFRVKALTDNFPQVLNLVASRPADADPLQLERMVYLDLRVVEVKRRALEELGVKWATSAAGPTIATNGLFYSNTPWRPAESTGFPPVNTTHPVASYFGLATQLTSALKLLEQRGDAWTLAEPSLSCRSGGEAKFLSGGEVPLPVAQGNGAVSVEYKKYGVVVEFKPVADGNGNIDSAIVVEVSEPDPRNSNQGFVAFTSSRAETQVAVRHGEPLVIAGLLRQATTKSSDVIPGIGRIPVIGRIFGARDTRTEQTELILIVNSRVITPDSALNKTGVSRAEELRQSIDARTTDELRPPGPQEKSPSARSLRSTPGSRTDSER